MSSSLSAGGMPLGEAVTNADYVILIADEGMHYLAASDAACDLLGYSREELLALSVPDLVVESNASELFDDFLRDKAQSGTITIRRKDRSLVVANYDARTTAVGGSPYYISVLTAPPVDSDGQDSSAVASRSVGEEDFEHERSLRELRRMGVISQTELEVELNQPSEG